MRSQIYSEECLSSPHQLIGLRVLLPFADDFSETAELSPFLLSMDLQRLHRERTRLDGQILQRNLEIFSQFQSFPRYASVQLCPAS